MGLGGAGAEICVGQGYFSLLHPNCAPPFPPSPQAQPYTIVSPAVLKPEVAAPAQPAPASAPSTLPSGPDPYGQYRECMGGAGAVGWGSQLCPTLGWNRWVWLSITLYRKG